MKLSYQRISTDDDLNALRGQWQHLLAETDADKLFMSYDWLQSWWRNFRASRELFIYLVRDGSELIAILPLMRQRKERFVELSILGEGTCDYFDFIVRGSYAKACFELFLQEILSDVGKWDVFRCPRLLDQNTTYLGLLEALEHFSVYRYAEMDYSHAPYVPVTGNWTQYRSSIKKKVLQDTQRQVRRLQELHGPIVYRVVTDAHELNSLFSRIVEFHKYRRAVVKRDYSVFSDSSAGSFYADVSRRLFDCGMLHLSVLQLDQDLLAIHLGYLVNGKFYYLIPVFNHTFENFSTGRMLLMRLLEEGFQVGWREFDFCYGEEPYKYDFASTERTLKQIAFFNNTVSGAIAGFWSKSVRERLRRSGFFMNQVLPRIKMIGSRE